jgi:hypothetical protein
MGQFNCPNVIKLEGVVTKCEWPVFTNNKYSNCENTCRMCKMYSIISIADRPWMIIIEFMANGSLDNFLKVYT